MWRGDIGEDLPSGIIRAWTGPDGVQHGEAFTINLRWEITHDLWRPTEDKIVEIDQSMAARFVAHVTGKIQDERRRNRKSGRR